MAVQLIAYHSEAIRGHEYPNKGGKPIYEFDKFVEYVRSVSKGSRIWVVVGKRGGNRLTDYFLQAVYEGDRVEPTPPESKKDYQIVGSELAYFAPSRLLNGVEAWEQFMKGPSGNMRPGGRLQGGLIKIDMAELIEVFEERLELAKSADGDSAVDGVLSSTEIAEMDAIGSEEGRRLLKTHYGYERDPKLARRKKSDALRLNGKIECECCGLDFRKAYGALGRDFAEAHHRTPLAGYRPIGKILTTLEELALVCANCHRVLHWHVELSVEELRRSLEASAAPIRRLVRK